MASGGLTDNALASKWSIAAIEDPHGTALQLISHKLCPYVQRAVIALERKGRSVRADRYRSRQQSRLVFEDFAARQGAGAAGQHAWTAKWRCSRATSSASTSRRRKEAPNCIRWIHLQRAQHRAWMEFGSGHSERTMGPGDDRRPRDLREQAAGGCREVRACRGSARRGPVLCRRRTSAWWTRCSRRSSAISTCSIS